MKKKHVVVNYYDNKETYTKTMLSKNNHKLYWKLLKDVFNNRTANDIPPISHTDSNGKDCTAFSDIDKIEILNRFFVQFLTFQIPVNPYRKCLILIESLADIVIEDSKVIDIISVLSINKLLRPSGLIV